MDDDYPVVRGGQGRSDRSVNDEGWWLIYCACLVIWSVAGWCFYSWLFLGRLP